MPKICLRACLTSCFRRVSEYFFAGQVETDDAKLKLLPGDFDEVSAENKPKRCWDGDIKQAPRLCRKLKIVFRAKFTGGSATLDNIFSY